MRKFLHYLIKTIPLFVRCHLQRTEEDFPSQNFKAPVMSLIFDLSKEDNIVFTHSFDSFREKRIENGETFSITHSITPDEAGLHEEICEVIITVIPDDYTIAAHIPIHESGASEVLEVGPYTLVFRCILPTK